MADKQDKTTKIYTPSELDAMKGDKREVIINGQSIGTIKRDFAQKYNFEQLKDIMMQNVSRTTRKTFTQFTKDALSNYLSNPYSSLDNIRQVSQYLYIVSPQYKTLINYLANMIVGSYNVIYQSPDWSNTLKTSDFMTAYQETCLRLQNMTIPHLSKQSIATMVRDGIYIGFCYDDKKSFFVNALDPSYCKISKLTAGNTYQVKFDASFFDVGNNSEFVRGVNEDGKSVWDQVFVKGYNDYKNLGRDYQWFDLPIEKTICIICGDDPVYPFPFFAPVFQDLLDILDYRDLIRSKTELENYVLLISKIPFISGSNEVNDFAVDMGIVESTQEMLNETLPSLVGAAYTPCDVEKIDFGNKNQVNDTDVYANSIKTLFDSIGISQMLFNGEKAGSVGLKHSIKVDEAVMFDFLERLEANIQRYLRLNISSDFLFYFHKVTEHSFKDYEEALQKKASFGLELLDYATIRKTPYEMMNSSRMENAMELSRLWVPLTSSHTQSGSIAERGAPTKDPDDLSDEGLKTRDEDKNGTTQAEK